MEELDLVVIGSGWYGLAAAKTYIQLHPSENVAVLDSSASVGGVWARERLYPGLNSNNMLGTYEYSDFPMDEATFGVAAGQHIPGTIVHSYLTKYAEHFGVYGCIRFNTLVETVEHHERGGWVLSVQHLISGSKTCLIAQRLIIATGLTSEAYIPTIAGSDSFGSPIFHPKDFARHRDTLTAAHNVSVLGGSKSAWDATYAYASAGVPVDMIIRKSGRGPVWMAPPYVTPLKRWLEKLVHTRLLTWFSPCIWGEEDGYVGIRRFLHGTWPGRKLVDAFWHILGNDVDTLVGFDKHPEIKKLKPWHDAFWIGSGLSILNYPIDFFELVRNGMIHVHVADIDHLSRNTVHLSNGEDVKANVLVCATGWKPRPPINFLPPSIIPQLGLPHYAPATDELVRKADAVILQQYPRLKDQPTVNHSEHKEDGSEGEKPNQPFRLYRFMVPPALLEDRNIAFAGMIATISTSICAQTQGLWISAFFDGRLDRLPGSLEEAQWQSMLHSRFGRWRYPCGYGARFPDFVFDAVPYIDMLLRDVNLEPHRKKGRLAEIVEPYGPEDYKNLPVEWAKAHGVSIQGLD
ncbi:hypothetical protein C8Q74DRAFT_1280559 [Fomes fomentarius]|nr:hypothetical protein C8Q74DRAFT_1280559 [Fomes fomentarius]